MRKIVLESEELRFSHIEVKLTRHLQPRLLITLPLDQSLYETNSGKNWSHASSRGALRIGTIDGEDLFLTVNVTSRRET